MADKFEIRLRIHDETELYSPFDEERLTIFNYFKAAQDANPTPL